jgi:transcription elongation GreA/GreB family factor
MNKPAVVKQIIAALAENLALLDKAARASHAEATHESSKAENKYDTRGLEAAYLAGGQARQARELADAIELYEKLPLRDFAKADPIDEGALIELEANGERSFYFIGPKSGGLEIVHQRKEIMVITPQSPLGANLIGKKSGDRWNTSLNGQNDKYHIVSVV